MAPHDPTSGPHSDVQRYPRLRSSARLRSGRGTGLVVAAPLITRREQTRTQRCRCRPVCCPPLTMRKTASFRMRTKIGRIGRFRGIVVVMTLHRSAGIQIPVGIATTTTTMPATTALQWRSPGERGAEAMVWLEDVAAQGEQYRRGSEIGCQRRSHPASPQPSAWPDDRRAFDPDAGR